MLRLSVVLVCVCQYADIVDPLLNAIEAITQRSQLTLSALAAADDDDEDVTDSFFHTLEVSFYFSLARVAKYCD